MGAIVPPGRAGWCRRAGWDTLHAEQGRSLSEARGRVFAGYELLHPIGQGGMGMVYRARQISLGREVALKVIRDGIKEMSTVFRRFERETRIHMQVAHPNLVAVLDAGVAEGRPFLAMELVDGKSLGDHIADRGPLPIPEVTAIGTQLADAIAYLHSIEILHRDLKPANILLGRGGEVKVVDFGLARFESETWLTTEQEWFGTVLYSAPEIFESREYAPPADIYSMGLILMEMLTGKPVVRAKVVTEAIEEILFRPVLPPRFQGRDGVPEDLEQLVMSMVTKDPAIRPSAGSVLARFQQLVEHPQTVASPGPAFTTAAIDPPVIAAPPVTEPDPPRPRRTEQRKSRSTGRRTGLRLSWLPLPERPFVIVLGVSMLVGLVLYTGFRWLVPEGPGHVTLVTSPSTVPSPGAASPGSAQLPSLLRARVGEVFALLHRYDQSCPDVGADRKEMVIRASILAEGFFRLRRGDVSILFTTLSRLRDVIREGDEARLDDPVWLDVERVAYEVIEEAARSHGFDTGSPLQPVLLRLEGEIAAGSPGSTRECLAISLLSQFAFFKEMSTDKLLVRTRFQRQLLDRVGALSAGWRGSPRGIFTRFNIFNRISDVHGSAYRVFNDRTGGDLLILLAASRRETFEIYLAEMDGTSFTGTDLELWALWLTFHAAASFAQHVGEDANLWRNVLRVLGRVAPKLNFAEMPPVYRNQFLEDLAYLMTEVERRGETTLDPVFAEAHRKWNGSAPVDNTRLLH